MVLDENKEIKRAVTKDENEIGKDKEGIKLFEAKKQDLSKHLGKNMLGIRKN